MALFRPKAIINKYTEFDINKYRQEGFEAIFLDIDNTIAIPDSGSCDEMAKNFIKKLQDAGYKVLIFSNNTKSRVKYFIGDMQIDYWFWAAKPLPFAYWLACVKMHCRPSKTIVLGDQLLTDILGANLSFTYGIYTKRLQENDSKITARNRKIEDFIWRNILNEKM